MAEPEEFYDDSSCGYEEDCSYSDEFGNSDDHGYDEDHDGVEDETPDESEDRDEDEDEDEHRVHGNGGYGRAAIVDRMGRLGLSDDDEVYYPHRHQDYFDRDFGDDDFYGVEEEDYPSSEFDANFSDHDGLD